MYSFLCFLFLPLLSVFMDITGNDTLYENTFFRKLKNVIFWKASRSQECKQFLGTAINAWHIAKFLFVVFLVLAVSLPILAYPWYIKAIAYWLIWTIFFTLPYKIVRKRIWG